MAATIARLDVMMDARSALEEAERGLKKRQLPANHRDIFQRIVQEGLTPRLPDLIEEHWRKCSVLCLGCDRDVAAVVLLTVTDAYSRKPATLTLCHDCLVRALVLVPEPVQERPWNWREQRAGR